MNDLADRVLEAIALAESSAEKDSTSTHTRYRIGGTYGGRRHVDVERRDGILRRCAADREIVGLYRDSTKMHYDSDAPHVMLEVIEALARGYGIEVNG